MINVELKIMNSIPSFRRGLGSLMIMVFMTTFITTTSFASASENFRKANAFYAEGKYQEAIEEYKTLLNTGNIATDIYFNLGNCYYKVDDISNSILNFERALKLKPDNEDALFNLTMANKRTVDKIDRLPELFIGNTWKNLVTSKTIENWSFYTIGLLFLSLILFVSYLLIQQLIIKKSGFYSGFLFLGLSMFTFLMASQHNSILEQSTEAIIFSTTTTIQSEPNTNAEKLFTLHEGTKVILLENNMEWSKIKLPNGNIGWIKTEEIKPI